MSIENSGNIVKTFMDLVQVDSPTFHEAFLEQTLEAISKEVYR